MEPRIARLEAHAEHAQSDLTGLKVDMRDVRERLARLEGAVDKLPGYGGIALIVGIIVGLSTLVQIAARFMPAGPTP